MALTPGTRLGVYDITASTFGDPSRYGVTPDAQRFLVLTTAAEEKGTDSTPPIHVVLDYAQALTP